MISIKGLDKAKVLAALYNHSRPPGMEMLHFTPEDMTQELAAACLENTRGREYGNFDYLQGRVMKVRLSGDEFDPSLYDRNLGEGAAALAIESVRT